MSLLDEVFGYENPTVVMISANWCKPCQRMHPIIDGLAQELDECEFQRVDIDTAEGSSLATELGVRTVPFFAFLHEGKVQSTYPSSGSRDQLREWIISNLERT
jgi:thioredoxin-like negative regulator of GroEL